MKKSLSPALPQMDSLKWIIPSAAWSCRSS